MNIIISIDREWAQAKTEHTFIIKTFKKLGIQQNNFNIIKAIYQKSTAFIIIIREKLDFSLKSGKRQKYLLSLLYLT